MARRHAEIAGAGFAGLTAATALAQRGWSVRVHERSPICREFGAGIWFWENGIRVLNSIGAADHALSEAIMIPAWESYDADGLMIDHFEFGNHLSGGRMFCLERQKLYEAILSAAERAGVDIVTSSKIVGAHPDGELLTEEGDRFRGDLVLGADGVHSRVRDSLDLLQERRQHEDGAIRVLVPRTEAEANDPDPRASMFQEWWNGTRRVLFNPCNKKTLYICLTTVESDKAAFTSPIPKSEWITSFPSISDYLDRLPESGRTDQFETITLKAWSRGRAGIIGDAAHGMVPGLGQGCGTAVTNAFTLAAHLDEHDVEAALAIWEKQHRPLTEHTQFWSWATWPLTRVPADIARTVFNQPGTKEWLALQRAQPSMNIPYGTAGQERWLPPGYSRAAAN